MNDMTSKPANAQDIVDRINPPKRYDSLTYSVSTLNEQITELTHENQTLDDGIDAWEAQVLDIAASRLDRDRTTKRLRALLKRSR